MRVTSRLSSLSSGGKVAVLICIVGVSAETSWLALVCIAGGLGDTVLELLDSRDRVSITLGTG
jgi:hypothetical protein